MSSDSNLKFFNLNVKMKMVEKLNFSHQTFNAINGPCQNCHIVDFHNRSNI